MVLILLSSIPPQFTPRTPSSGISCSPCTPLTPSPSFLAILSPIFTAEDCPASPTAPASASLSPKVLSPGNIPPVTPPPWLIAPHTPATPSRPAPFRAHTSAPRLQKTLPALPTIETRNLPVGTSMNSSIHSGPNSGGSSNSGGSINSNSSNGRYSPNLSLDSSNFAHQQKTKAPARHPKSPSSAQQISDPAAPVPPKPAPRPRPVLHHADTFPNVRAHYAAQSQAVPSLHVRPPSRDKYVELPAHVPSPQDRRQIGATGTATRQRARRPSRHPEDDKSETSLEERQQLSTAMGGLSAGLGIDFSEQPQHRQRQPHQQQRSNGQARAEKSSPNRQSQERRLPNDMEVMEVPILIEKPSKRRERSPQYQHKPQPHTQTQIRPQSQSQQHQPPPSPPKPNNNSPKPASSSPRLANSSPKPTSSSPKSVTSNTKPIERPGPLGRLASAVGRQLSTLESPVTQAHSR